MTKRIQHNFALDDGRVALPSGEHSSTMSLELDDDISQFQISLLLKVSQDTSTEEDLTLADAEEVGLQIKSFDLRGKHNFSELRKPFFLNSAKGNYL